MRLFMSLDRSIESKQPALTVRFVPPCARLALAAIACLGLHAAHAQVSASASVTSEYTQRGKSLSKGRVAPQLRVDYDNPSGWYAGALLSRAALPYSDTSAQVVAFGGYAQQLASGMTWEAGALDASFVGDQEYRYHEFYAGLSRERVSARVYFSPHYYGAGKTLYAELNGSYPLHDHLVLVGHIGFLHPFSTDGEEDRQRLDLRIGLGYDVGDWNFQVALLANGPRRKGPEAPRAIAVSVSYGF
jgi:uncharacterized protein (TIGR02001 family)